MKHFLLTFDGHTGRNGGRRRVEKMSDIIGEYMREEARRKWMQRRRRQCGSYPHEFPCNDCAHSLSAFIAAHLFPDESGAFLMQGRFIVVVDIKLREQDLIFVCS